MKRVSYVKESDDRWSDSGLCIIADNTYFFGVHNYYARTGHEKAQRTPRYVHPHVCTEMVNSKKNEHKIEAIYDERG